MRWFSGGTHRFRPVVVCLFLLVIPLFVFFPAGASSCGLSENVCPVCPAGGLALNDSSAWDGNYPDTLATSNGFAELTCNYGNPLSGNTVTVKIDCYKDAGIAQKWYQYYRKEIPYPFPETGYGSANQYAEHTKGHRVGVQAYWGTGPKPAYTYKSAYSDWDYALTGRYEAEIESLTPTDTITQQEASAINVKRIQQFTSCFASFKPGGVQAPAPQKLTGTIIATDLPYGKPRPLKYALVSYIRDDGKIDRTTTNDKGEYSFDTLLIPGNRYTLNITLTYAQDKDYFTLGLYRDDSGINPLLQETDDFEPIVFSHPFTYRTGADLRQDLTLDDLWRKTGKPGNNPFGIMYVHHQEALEFYRDYLKEEIRDDQTVRVYLFADKKWVAVFGTADVPRAFYSGGDIFYGNNKSVPADPEDQRRTVYHEFSHYMMDTLYGKLPEKRTGPGAPPGLPDIKSHQGFVNPSTTDSWTEGFADFMPGVMQDNYHYGRCGVTSWADLEASGSQPWTNNGADEEWAVASFLWDTYDSPAQLKQCFINSREYYQNQMGSPYVSQAEKDNIRWLINGINTRERNNNFADDDRISMNFPDLWKLLRVYRADVNELYNAIQGSGRISQEDLKVTGVAHGLWVDTDTGNNVHDPLEPFRDADSNQAYDQGEYFIDLPAGGMNWKAGETVGNPGNYQRPWRLTTKDLPGHYIKVNNAVPYYLCLVEYPGTDASPYLVRSRNENGYIYAPIPPNPAAKITITADGVETGNPLSYTSREFYAQYDRNVRQGYFKDHDFRIKGPVPTPPAMPDFSQGGHLGQGSSGVLRLPDLFSERSHVPLIISVPVAIVSILLLVYFVRKEF